MYRNKCLILDDIGDFLLSNRSFTEMLNNKRGLGLCVFAVLHDLSFILRKNRSNYELAWIARQNNLEIRESIRRTFFGQFFSKPSAINQVFNEMKQYEFLVTDQTFVTKTKIDA